MSINNYRQTFKSAIARIYYNGDVVVGAGFLITEHHLLTCAHVVVAALGKYTTAAELPLEWLELDFPLIAPGQKIRAKVKSWKPVQFESDYSLGEVEDIAVLQLESPPPKGCQAVRLVVSKDLWQHAFQIFGFPSSRPNGIWASGVMRDQTTNGWIQMEDIKAQGYSVEPGFSGAPVWDEYLEGVAGMAVAYEKKREEAKAAFMIPTALFESEIKRLDPSILEGINNQVLDQNILDSSFFQKVKLKLKRDHWMILVGKYNTIYNQLNSKSNQLQVIQMREQLKLLEKEIANEEQEINKLALNFSKEGNENLLYSKMLSIITTFLLLLFLIIGFTSFGSIRNTFTFNTQYNECVELASTRSYKALEICEKIYAICELESNISKMCQEVLEEIPYMVKDIKIIHSIDNS